MYVLGDCNSQDFCLFGNIPCFLDIRKGRMRSGGRRGGVIRVVVDPQSLHGLEERNREGIRRVLEHGRGHILEEKECFGSHIPPFSEKR